MSPPLVQPLIRTANSALEFVSSNGYTPLHYFCNHSLVYPNCGHLGKDRVNNTLQMIALLLDNGASISAQNTKG
ncbi:hypothetical protein BDW62DRAFT_172483 [Aspergillus aurantiobrunneus]